MAFLSYTSVIIAGYPAENGRPGLATIKVSTSYQAPDNIHYQPGYPPLMITIPDPVEEDRMINDVRQAKQQADIVLVAFHWGVSHGYGRVVGYQKELGRAAIDAGADLIMGAHPHALMAMEMYKGKLICYSMGNFVMDGFTSSHFGADTMILTCHVQDKKIKKCSFIPARISDQWQPALDEATHARPADTTMLTAPAQRAMPQPSHLKAKRMQRGVIHGRTVVAICPPTTAPPTTDLRVLFQRLAVRTAQHDSEPVGVANTSPYDFFIHNTSSV